MKRRNWSSEEKLAIVLEGLKETRTVAEICREDGISQTLYYRWRDKFLEGGRKALTNGSRNKNTYIVEVEKLQKIIGKQAIQIEILKKRGVVRGKIKSVNELKVSGYTVKDVCEALGFCRSGYYAARKPKEIKNRRKKTVICLKG